MRSKAQKSERRPPKPPFSSKFLSNPWVDSQSHCPSTLCRKLLWVKVDLVLPDLDDIVHLSMLTQEKEKGIQEWCVNKQVALPLNPLETADGRTQPLTAEEEEEEKEFTDHINPSHLTKRHLCKGCLLPEGPRRVHRRVRDVDRATQTAYRHCKSFL